MEKNDTSKKKNYTAPDLEEFHLDGDDLSGDELSVVTGGQGPQGHNRTFTYGASGRCDRR